MKTTRWAALFLAVFFLAGCGQENGATTMPVGTANLCYLQKTRSGTAFYEGFENDNFINAEGWTILQGTPANTGSQYYAGIKSWDNQANGGSLPVASVVVPSANFSNQWVAHAWFYDTGNTTAPGPYIKLLLANGNYASIGVRNSVSTTQYCYSGTFNSSTDAPDTAIPSANRSAGWHFILFRVTNGQLYYQVDGVNVAGLFGAGVAVSEIFLCADVVGGPGPSFGYFDEVACFVDGTIYFNFPTALVGSTAAYYNSSNVYQGGGVHSYIILGSAVIPVPYPIYLEFSQPSNTNALLFRTPLVNVNPGDIYNVVCVNFTRKLTRWRPQNAGLVGVNQSTSGVTETIFNAFKNKYAIMVQDLQGLNWKEAIDEWYNYAVQGYPFSIQGDSNNVGMGILAAAPAVGQNTVTIMPNLGANPTSGFTTGRQYVIANAGNTLRQSVTLASDNTNQLTFDNPIEYPFQQGDYVCDLTYMPFLELGSNPYGLQMTDERYKRFDWNQVVQDYNGG